MNALTTAWPYLSWAIAAIVAALLLALGHWFPWPDKLGRIPAYVYGSASILLAFAAWRLLNGDWHTPLGLAALYLIGYLVVCGAYRIDGWVITWRKAQKAEATDDELK
jgi:hypothetical protein